MSDTANSINQKDSILIARNTPVAVVIGGAGFIGSYLVEELLKKNIQVIAVDNLSSGFKEYLGEATKNKNFHFLNDNAGNFNPELPRLDYIFIVAEGNWNLNNVLELAKKHHSKIVFVSSVELYNDDSPAGLEWFKDSEVKVAQFAAEHNLNARVVRLAAVYGPRMHFREADGLIELLKATLLGQLQKYSLTNQFSTRAIFVKDGVNLIIKSMFVGATALKIFDGALDEPIQLAEVKQVLLDPVWYENRGFKPTELPPWVTPNLDKTIKILNWQPRNNLVKSLKETLSYFKDSEIPVAKIIKVNPDHKINLWVSEEPTNRIKMEKKENLQNSSTPINSEQTIKSRRSFFINKSRGQQLLQITLLVIVFYAIFYPLISVAVGVLNYKNRLIAASVALKKGDFDTSINLIDSAQESITAANFLISSVQIARQNGWFVGQFALADDLTKSASLVAGGTKEVAIGTKSLYQTLKIILGQDPAKLTDTLDSAKLQLTSADSNFGQAQAILSSDSFKNHLPGILQSKVHNLQDRLDYGQQLTTKASTIANLISPLTAVGGKSYLIILQDQSELRSTGGLIVGLVKLNFTDGQLKTFTVLNPQDLDKNLSVQVEPPTELKNDLGLKNWNLANANWEEDFPSSGRQIVWFVNQETGQTVNGVVSLNLLTLKDLLTVIGPVQLPGSNTEITNDNLLTQAFSANQQDFYTAVLTAVFNKLLTPQDLNWPGVLGVIDQSLANKNIEIYLDDTHSLALLAEKDWTGELPRPTTMTTGVLNDFLATTESNLGGNKANYFVSQNRQLETTIKSDGEITHKLTINYKNDSQNETYPAGSYKNNLRFYLPFGSKISSISWGSDDLTKSATNFSDYGRSGFSLTTTLPPQNSKTLVIEYTLPEKITFADSQAKYNLNLVKQPGVDYQLKWQLNYPVNFKLLGEPEDAGQKELTLDVTSDQLLSVVLTK